MFTLYSMQRGGNSYKVRLLLSFLALLPLAALLALAALALGGRR